ncbi:hypothetical protein [Streptomyces sp. S.PB5]|uniref:hypothetical protein n=1 Tax=Streptomyces sp. S.PB5 TaxID=3020844 RepID=UPI0025B1C78B|nr:hypothetical protein [Streptomyces sp. S.PB5]MDN3024544.1 hypothetical protein [Streptomyces sp. S.PB5]
MSFRRSVALTTLAALTALTMTACGTEKAGQTEAEAGAGAQTGAAGPTPSYSYPPPPKCAQAASTPTPPPSSPPASSPAAGSGQEGPVDAPPNYADNHAYRMRAGLSAERQASGLASAELIRKELEKVREEGSSGEYGVFPDARVEAALKRLGCGEEHGVSVGGGFYAVYTGIACVSGRVTKDELTSEVHGVYAEPQPGEGPCVENRGGH